VPSSERLSVPQIEGNIHYAKLNRPDLSQLWEKLWRLRDQGYDYEDERVLRLMRGEINMSCDDFSIITTT